VDQFDAQISPGSTTVLGTLLHITNPAAQLVDLVIKQSHCQALRGPDTALFLCVTSYCHTATEIPMTVRKNGRFER
jgi:hypothetical protein